MVLDASAVLALLQDERGADAVEDAVDEGALISAVNLSEVLAKMTDAGATAHEAADLIVSLFVEVEPFGLASAREPHASAACSRQPVSRWAIGPAWPWRPRADSRPSRRTVPGSTTPAGSASTSARSGRRRDAVRAPRGTDPRQARRCRVR